MGIPSYNEAELNIYYCIHCMMYITASERGYKGVAGEVGNLLESSALCYHRTPCPRSVRNLCHIHFFQEWTCIQTMYPAHFWCCLRHITMLHVLTLNLEVRCLEKPYCSLRYDTSFPSCFPRGNSLSILSQLLSPDPFIFSNRHGRNSWV